MYFISTEVDRSSGMIDRDEEKEEAEYIRVRRCGNVSVDVDDVEDKQDNNSPFLTIVC